MLLVFFNIFLICYWCVRIIHLNFILRRMISIAFQADGSREKTVQSQHHLVFLINSKSNMFFCEYNRIKGDCAELKKSTHYMLTWTSVSCWPKPLPLVYTNLSETCLIPWVRSFSRAPYFCGILCHIKLSVSRRYCARAGIRRVRNMKGDRQRERERRRKDIHN